MSRTNAKALLEQMLESASEAVSCVEGLTLDDFLADRRTQAAVSMNLINVGEAAPRLLRDHEAFAARHPQVPWRLMLAMRNRIAHNYFDLNLPVVWKTVTTSLPESIAALPSIIQSAPGARPDSHGDA